MPDTSEKFKDSNVLFMAERMLHQAPAKVAIEETDVPQGEEVSAQDAQDFREPLASQIEREHFDSVPVAFDPEVKRRSVSYIPVDRIKISPFQTRQIFRESELEDLARSIESKGVIQPVIARPLNSTDGLYSYELVAGERRLRAAKSLGMKHIPAIIQDLEDKEVLELAIVENAQREDLNPVEEALAFKRLVDEFDSNQTDIARAIGKNRATISNALRLLQLQPEVIELLRTGDLSAGHGRALLMIEDPRKQLSLARRTSEQSLSVRALEALVARVLEGQEEERDEEFQKLRASLDRQEQKLSEAIGVEKVKLQLDPQGRRRLQITFDTEASWKRFTSRMRD